MSTSFIENPNIIHYSPFHFKQISGRSYHLPEDTQFLNGTWDFKYSEQGLRWAHSIIDAPGFWFNADSDKVKWSNIQVPGHWQLQGWGIPQYVNIKYPIPVNPPFVPANNPTGIYRKTFKLESQHDVQKRDIRLRFDGVDSAYYAYLNGQFIGFSKGSRNSAEFDITSVVREQNELVIIVVQWSDATYIEDQDQWWLSGIFRDVSIISFDKQAHIEDFYFDTIKIDHETNEAEVNVQVRTELTAPEALLSVEITSSEEKNRFVQSETFSKAEPIRNFVFTIKNADLWHPETPTLYNVHISISVNGKTTHGLTTHLGIRTTEVHDGLLKVNGKRIVLRGVNRHDHHHKKGRAVSEQDVKNDLLLMKQHNINAIRCSHYPSHPKLLHWADILGFYVIDEADLECHGFGDCNAPQRPDEKNPPISEITRTNPYFHTSAEAWTSDNPQWKNAYIDRVERMTARDKCHPSVIIWSLGNESFYGENHVAMYHWLKANFPRYPVHYEGDNYDGYKTHTMDVVSRMYPDPEWMATIADKVDRPFILCEYGHAMGNGPGSLKEYVELFYKYPRLQGGCIWEWANHGLLTEIPGKSGQYYEALGGDFGEPVHDFTFCMDGLCRSDHTPFHSLVEYKYAIQPATVEIKRTETGVNITVTNRHDATSLDRYGFEFVLDLLPRDADSSKVVQFYKANLSYSPDVGPGESWFKDIDIDWKDVEKHPNMEALATVRFYEKNDTPWAKAGHEVGFHQEILVVTDAEDKAIEETDATTLTTDEDVSSISITSTNAKVDISKVTGNITELSVNGFKPFLEEPVYPGLWRALTDNDKGDVGNYWKRYYVDKMHESVTSVTVEESSKSKTQVKVVKYVAPAVLAWGIEVTMTYTFYLVSKDELAVDTHMKFIPRGPFPDSVPRIGLDFVLDKSLTEVEWYGRDTESYRDSLCAARFGVHKANTADLYENYEVPQDNGNRADVKWVTVASSDQSVAVSFTSGKNTGTYPSDKFNFAAQPWTPYQLEKATHPYELKEEEKANNFRVDFEVYPLGSQSCGPPALERYRIFIGPSEYNASLRVRVADTKTNLLRKVFG